MKSIHSNDIQLPAFFNRLEMTALLAQMGNVDDKIEVIEEEVIRCEDFANDLVELAGYDPERPDLLPEHLVQQVDQIRGISNQLEYIDGFLRIGKHMIENELYAWRPPKNRFGDILWDETIDPPKMEPFQHTRHTVNVRERFSDIHGFKAETAEEWRPNVIFYTPDYQKIKGPLSVRAACHHPSRVGELEDISKQRLNTAIESIATAYEDQKILLDANDSNLPNILRLLNTPKILQLRSTGNGICPN